MIIDLKDQENYIVVKGEKFPYKGKVELSADLLIGKRKNVFNTAVRHYYSHACQVAEGMQIAAAYRANANIIKRELK